jgi:N-acetyl-alpha-D-muramate 1-phosphate uridylyltransferase
MVLGAGMGTRMRPYTDRLPKPLVPLKGRALVDHVLDRLADAGVLRAIVNVHHKADLLEQHLSVRTRPRIEISDERNRLLDTGGGVRNVLDAIGPDPFIVHNSDSVWIDGPQPNLDRLFAAWDEDKMDCLLLLALGSASIGYEGRGDFSFDPDSRIRRRREGEVVPFVYAGVQIVHPRIFAGTPDGPFSFNLLWNKALLLGRAYGLRMDGIWMHVGTPQALTDAERCMNGEGMR